MTYRETMQELEKHGTAQNVKVYKRHGAGENLFGVSFANLEKLRKRIKVDHDLALDLWQSGNADARSLAVMIADPLKMTKRDLELWVGDTRYYMLIDLIVCYLAGKSLHARTLMESWTLSNNEWFGQAGWDLLGMIAMQESALNDRYFDKYLSMIESEIHHARNRTRHAMNSALIAIGIRNGALEKKAIAAAKRIGKVEVDHGETGCKTPDAVQYILKAASRKKKGSSVTK